MSFVYSHPFTGLANGLNTINAAGGGIGGWVELGRTTLGSAGDTISVSSLSDKRYYQILCHGISSGNIGSSFRFNSDSGSNYASRYSTNGGADSTQTSGTYGIAYPSDDSSSTFQVGYIANLSSNEKLAIINNCGANDTSAASAAPTRRECVFKWANTSNAINEIIANNVSAGDFNTGSELVVLGWDPADTHTNNYWQELASVDLSGGAADNLSSGTITAKKYLWIQYYVQASGSAGANFQFNNDTGSNYAHRRQDNGTSDATATSQTDIEMRVSYGDSFGNMFIINNASNEKLVIAHEIDNPTAGAATAPQRTERVAKWTNTSNQITEIDLNNDGGGDFDTGTIMKVWGAD